MTTSEGVAVALHRHVWLWLRPCALWLFLTGAVYAQAPPPIPDTPAGHAFGAWLHAVNSGDRASHEAFLKDWPSWMTVDGVAQWNAGTGGYDLLEVSASDPTNVFFRVKQKRWAVEEIGRLQVSVTGTIALEALEVWRLPAGASFEPVTLDNAARARVIEQTAGILTRFHIDQKIGQRLSAALRRRAERGEYRLMAYGEKLATKLTEDLREIDNDQHLEVRFSYAVQREGLAARNSEEKLRLLADNCGVEKVDHLRPNIGYLKLNVFADPEVCAATVSAAMNVLAESDALILDLRDNTGGRGGMVEYLASYLFAGRTHLSDTFRRADSVTTESWTLPHVPGRKFIDKPVLVLISKRTFSAGEGLAYVLKDLKRATLIGETTVGGSGTIEFKSIDDHFLVVVPTGRVMSPITKTGWMGTGVEPDIKVAAADALDEALRRARGAR